MGELNEQGHGATNKDRDYDSGSGEIWRLTKFLTASAFLTALVFWPSTFSALSTVWAPDVVKDVGSVQKIHFVGGIRISTQIDTETGTLLIYDTVNLPKGTLLQTRESHFGWRVCVANTQRCWRAARL